MRKFISLFFFCLFCFCQNSFSQLKIDKFESITVPETIECLQDNQEALKVNIETYLMILNDLHEQPNLDEWQDLLKSKDISQVKKTNGDSLTIPSNDYLAWLSTFLNALGLYIDAFIHEREARAVNGSSHAGIDASR
jgi:hypothetical protein